MLGRRKSLTYFINVVKPLVDQLSGERFDRDNTCMLVIVLERLLPHGIIQP